MDVPGLINRSTTSGALHELDSTVTIIHASNSIRTLIQCATVLAIGVLFDNHSIAYLILIRFTLSILTCVVLIDKLLLSIADVLPIRFKADVVNRVTIEYEL